MHSADNKVKDMGRGFDLKRIAVAVILIPLIISYIYYLPPFPFFFILLLIVVMVSLAEFFSMYNVRRGLYIPSIFLGGVFFYVICLHPDYIVKAIFGIVSIILLIRLGITTSPLGSMKELGVIGMGFLYITVFLCFQWFLRDDIMGRQNILLLYGSVWSADSMAYYIGTYLGKNRLYPSVSPNKTIEGAVGSVIGGAIATTIIAVIFYNPDELPVLRAIIIGIIIGIASVLGDLIESMFKRDAGVKDSSNIIPGHGGLLDKIDSVLLAGPVLYLIM
ncbi:MAG: phosphatidate cytidylyltransferase [Thermodesulfovibrionia bacterium]